LKIGRNPKNQNVILKLYLFEKVSFDPTNLRLEKKENLQKNASPHRAKTSSGIRTEPINKNNWASIKKRFFSS